MPDKEPTLAWGTRASKLTIFVNNDAGSIRKACKQVLDLVLENKTWPVALKKNLIDWCLWKYPTCSYVFSSNGKYPNKKSERRLGKEAKMLWGDKYASPYYTEEAWAVIQRACNKSSIVADLRFEHVYEKKWLTACILQHPEMRRGYFTRRMGGCVVTHKEHRLLGTSSGPQATGWQRYQGKLEGIFHVAGGSARMKNVDELLGEFDPNGLGLPM